LLRAGSHIVVSSGNASLSSDTALLTQQYAVCRYVQAIQAGTWVPVKFNGQMFTANLVRAGSPRRPLRLLGPPMPTHRECVRAQPPETKTSGPTARDWGANSWWQNTVMAMLSRSVCCPSR